MSDTKPSRSRVRAHRARLRAQGLRPLQIWVPDVDAPEFAEQAHVQSARVASSPDAADSQDFVDSLASETPGWA